MFAGARMTLTISNSSEMRSLFPRALAEGFGNSTPPTSFPTLKNGSNARPVHTLGDQNGSNSNFFQTLGDENPFALEPFSTTGLEAR